MSFIGNTPTEKLITASDIDPSFVLSNTNIPAALSGKTITNSSIGSTTPGTGAFTTGTFSSWLGAAGNGSGAGQHVTLKAGFGTGAAAGNLYLGSGRGNAGGTNGNIQFGNSAATDAAGLDSVFATISSTGMYVTPAGNGGISTNNISAGAVSYSVVNGYSGRLGYTMQSGGSAVNTSWGMITDQTSLFFASAAYNIGANGNLSTGWTTRMTLDSSGNLLVGTNAALNSGTTIKTPNGVSVYRNDSTAVYAGFSCYSDNGSVQALKAYFRNDGGLANYSANNANLSDSRLKKDIQPSGNYLAKICAIEVKTFRYNSQDALEDVTLGVIAQDVEVSAPELVSNDGFGDTPEDGIPLKAIYQTDLQYALMKCIQELSTKNDALEARLAALESAP